MEFLLNSKVLWWFFINISTFGRAPWPSILAGTILIASDKNLDGTGLGKTQSSEGSNLLESSHHKRKSWRVDEQASRILPLSLVCASLSVSLLSSTQMGFATPGAYGQHWLIASRLPERKSLCLGNVQKSWRRALTGITCWGVPFWGKGQRILEADSMVSERSKYGLPCLLAIRSRASVFSSLRQFLYL